MMKIASLLLFLLPLPLLLCGQALPSAQTLRGAVSERSGGRPVPYATVVLAGVQPAVGTVTDSLGRFALTGVPVGRCDVEVSCLGYEPVLLKEILVGSSKEVVLDVRLQESLIAVGEVVVRPTVDKTQPLNSMALAGGRMLSVEEASRYAGGMDDPARLAHLTVSYRINRRRVAHEFALKVLNLTGYKDYYGHRYNYLTGQVEPEREANIIPNISYRIEF